MLRSGFQSTNRANPLAQKILAADIAQGLNDSLTFYTPDNWAFLPSNVEMPANHNYMKPVVQREINGQTFVESQRFGDVCPTVVDVPAEPFFAPECVFPLFFLLDYFETDTARAGTSRSWATPTARRPVPCSARS